MGGASSVPPADPNAMGGDPSMGGPNAMGGDPSMGDPNAMGGDPSMSGPDGMGGPEDMGAPEDMGSEGGDSTMDIINQLSDEDREAVRSYAESMLSRDETKNNEEQPMDDPSMGGEDGDAPMMEGVIFTKAQIRKINENFGPTEDELNQKNDKRKPLGKKNGNKSVSRKSPFNSPKFK